MNCLIFFYDVRWDCFLNVRMVCVLQVLFCRRDLFWCVYVRNYVRRLFLQVCVWRDGGYDCVRECAFGSMRNRRFNVWNCFLWYRYFASYVYLWFHLWDSGYFSRFVYRYYSSFSANILCSNRVF